MKEEGNVLFNDAPNTFYLQLYGVRHMVKDHSDSERGNPLPPHRLLFPISSKGFLYASSHRQDNTYHSLCYTSRGALARTRNSSWVHPWRINPTTHHTMSERSTHGAASRSLPLLQNVGCVPLCTACADSKAKSVWNVSQYILTSCLTAITSWSIASCSSSTKEHLIATLKNRLQKVTLFSDYTRYC